MPRESGKPLSRWSAKEITQEVIKRRIVTDISAPTIKRWLQQDKIKPWRYHYWQRPTDPKFLEKAIPILDLYERAQPLAERGQIIVCTDEKTSIQARQPEAKTRPAAVGQPMQVCDRYKRQGALQLFTALLVSTGETMARGFPTKTFADFKTFAQMVFHSLWCKGITCLHLILDNGSTHAPKQLEAWIKSLKLPFKVRIYWTPVHASWLDQVEIVFSQVQRQVLTPNDFDDLNNLETTLMDYFDYRNLDPKPIQWTYTSAKLIKDLGTNL